MKCAHYAINFYRDQDKLPEIWEKQDIARSKDEMKAKAMKKIREVWAAYSREKETVKRLKAEKEALERDQDELLQKYNEKSRQKRRLEEMMNQGNGRLRQDGPHMLTSSPHVHTPANDGAPNPNSYLSPHMVHSNQTPLPYPHAVSRRLPMDRPPPTVGSEGQMRGQSGMNNSGPWATKRHRSNSYVYTTAICRSTVPS